MEINKRNKAVRLKDEDDNDVFIAAKKCFNIFSSKYYNTKRQNNDIETQFWCCANGYKSKDDLHFRTKPFYNTNIVGYLVSASFGIDIKHIYLLDKFCLMEMISTLVLATLLQNSRSFVQNFIHRKIDGNEMFILQRPTKEKNMLQTRTF